jgi:acyl-CoA thioesterase I
VIRPAAAALAALLAGCAAPAPAATPAATPMVLTFGDSVPAGTACGCTPFPELYARRLDPGAVSVNRARPGRTAADVRAELDTADAAAAVRHADVVLIMAGANDVAAAFEAGAGAAAYARTAAVLRRDMAAAVTRIRALRGTTVTVLVLGYWNVVEDGAVGRADYGPGGTADAQAATHYADDALSEAAGAAGAQYLDTSPALKGDDGATDPTGLLAPDGDHPNARGHAAIAAAVHAAVPQPARRPPPG